MVSKYMPPCCGSSYVCGVKQNIRSEYTNDLAQYRVRFVQKAVGDLLLPFPPFSLPFPPFPFSDPQTNIFSHQCGVIFNQWGLNPATADKSNAGPVTD